jgi:putative peptidoglycan lipid II flippase
MIFFVIPIATFFIVLRTPIVRLVYGTNIFSWEATVQTGYVLSAFSVGIVTQSVTSLLARSFYALHDTKTPVVVSVSAILLIVFLDFLFIKILGFDVWGLAAAFSIGSFLQAITLFYLINRKIGNGSFIKLLTPVIKSIIAAMGSGGAMYFLLKFFDRWTWIKRISLISAIDISKNINFESFVLDTRYTINLIILTAFAALVGGLIYLILAIVLKSKQVWHFFNLIRRILVRKVPPIPTKEQEPLSPTTTDNPLE